MKKLFYEHSYDMVKMFLNQFATSLFGFVLALASVRAGNTALRLGTSIAAIVFYLFLLYTMTWPIGFRDRTPVLHGRAKATPWKGFAISFFANAVNFLCAILIMLASLLDVPFFSTAGGFSHAATYLLEGMYTGVLMIHVGDAALNSYWFMYFLITIPSILISGIAYLMGFHDKKYTKLFDPVYPESDREPKKKREHRDD